MLREILLSALAAAMLFPGRVQAAERYDYCHLPDASVILFAIDRTDPWDDIDKDVMSSAAARILTGLKPGDRLIIRTITDDPSSSKQLFDECQPACPPQGLWDEIMGTCREAIVRKDAVSFRNGYAKALLPLLQTTEEHDGSAIIETISALTRQYADTGVDRLIVFSDLVQNSKLGNFLKMSKKDLNRTQEKVRQLGLTSLLTAAAVVDFGFGRTQGENRKGLTPEINARIESFWRAYFSESGASSVEINQRYE